MPKLSELMNDAVPVKFTHRGREYNLQAYPECASHKLHEESKIKDKADKGAGDAHTITRLVKSWDITGDDEQPLPINRATIDELPEGLKLALVGAIMQECVNPTSAASAA